MADGLLQPRIGGLYHGVSRQAPLQRSPNQMQDLENFLPSVDIGGIVDRTGTRSTFAVSKAGISSAQCHHFFRTTNGQRWVLMRREAYGQIEVRNVDTGEQASVSYAVGTQDYIAGATNLQFMSLADTTIILNPGVVVTLNEPGRPALTACYVTVEKLSTAAQSFTIAGSNGIARWSLLQNQGNLVTRDFIAMALMNTVNQQMPGISATLVAGNVIRLSGDPGLIAAITASNDWDTTAMRLIKGQVSAISELPPRFEPWAPIAVDPGNGDSTTLYYVMYDPAKNAWVESSYLPFQGATAYLGAGQMPIKLRQLTHNSFALETCPWTPRKTGDSESNPAPYFVGRRITAMAQWKGRMWFGTEDKVVGSQPDDLYNFFRESAREVRPADPVELSCDSPDLSVIQHIVAFRNKLMVLTDNAQLEIPGDKPVTPEDAVIGVATRYQIDRDCPPQVIGDALYYTGQAEGRSVLWEYAYDEGAGNNTAFDLSKHIPGYVPGRVRMIRGSAQAGRTFAWTPSDPSRLYVHTAYWKDGQRSQNAWARLQFPGVSTILAFWVDQTDLFILAQSSFSVWVCKMRVDVSLGDDPLTDARLDYLRQVQIFWNVARNRSEVILPDGFSDHAGSLTLLVDRGDTWFHEINGSVIWDGTQYVFHFPTNTGVNFGHIGVRFARTAIFSPFYPSLGESVTPEGRLQIRTVVLDALVSCDFTATVTRSDRPPMSVARSPRAVGEALVPLRGYNQQHRVPFNSKGDQAQLAVSSTSTGPMALTGFTLLGRYTNPTAS
ncbi:phage nozzle protein [Variovorax paradoxus]|uniref:phage nozzle protein n=1 Tax=Variovorax paradoxus TaxID=34073 RepID=UPI0029C90504|nr:hypothetical protein [Variovorax paradoxus]WPH18227.1 hypothetical protein RZE78_14415 [Variovorax paradoxus]